MAAKNSKNTVPAVVVTLADIVAAGAEGVFTVPSIHTPLVEKGLVEINPAMVDAAGFIATRATQAGIEAVNGPAPIASSCFQIENNVPIPAVVGRGRADATVYPFDSLQVGQSFFVPNTEKKPDAAKSMASTVSSAVARYAIPDPSGATKTVPVKQYQVEPNGKIALDANGKRIVLSETTKQVPVMIRKREFVLRAVEGGARIWRTK